MITLSFLKPFSTQPVQPRPKVEKVTELANLVCRQLFVSQKIIGNIIYNHIFLHVLRVMMQILPFFGLKSTWWYKFTGRFVRKSRSLAENIWIQNTGSQKGKYFFHLWPRQPDRLLERLINSRGCSRNCLRCCSWDCTWDCLKDCSKDCLKDYSKTIPKTYTFLSSIPGSVSSSPKVNC